MSSLAVFGCAYSSDRIYINVSYYMNSSINLRIRIDFYWRRYIIHCRNAKTSAQWQIIARMFPFITSKKVLYHGVDDKSHLSIDI